MLIWNFYKLPDEAKAQVRDLYAAGNLEDLRKLLNKHRVAGAKICDCPGAAKRIRHQVAEAIKQKVIPADP